MHLQVNPKPQSQVKFSMLPERSSRFWQGGKRTRFGFGVRGSRFKVQVLCALGEAINNHDKKDYKSPSKALEPPGSNEKQGFVSGRETLSRNPKPSSQKGHEGRLTPLNPKPAAATSCSEGLLQSGAAARGTYSQPARRKGFSKGITRQARRP